MNEVHKPAGREPREDAPASAASDGGVRARQPRSRDDDIDAYLVELGQRVRSMRAVRGMSRKVLAQESGVSERYIAQLESGLGNVSIMLLRRVADATGAPLEDLVADPARQPQDWPLIRELLRKASPDMVADVKAVLSGHPVERPAHAPRVEVDRVALIGLRGAGKSTLGRLAAEKLGWRFVELNKEIEREAGFSITEVFSIYGQDGYRRYEQAALERIIGEPGAMILATGGGIVSDPVTFERLLGSFFTVWVKASPGEHMGRVRKQGDLRPMGADKAAMSELITILQSREPLYSRARVAIDTSGATIDQSLLALTRTIQSYCVSGCPWQSRNRA
jgi:XRE family transcriptional regulator, aerobic/anaerobic benzoate catabolism transcriptional regulator